MAETKYTLPGDGLITMSCAAADKLLRRCDGDAALLYLYILRTGGSFDDVTAAEALGRASDDIRASLRVLAELGLIIGREKPLPNAERPQYTHEDIHKVIESDSSFTSLVHEVGTLLGHGLISEETSTLLRIYRSLGLPYEVILLLVNYCISETERTQGKGRVPTMRRIERTACDWEEREILSLERAEKYLHEREESRTELAAIRRLLGITERTMSPSERKYIEGWIALGYRADVVSVAYDRTVSNTGGLAWRYMDSIISNWNKMGIKTVEDIALKDPPRSAAPRERQNKGEVRNSPTRDDYQRNKRMLEKMKEAEDVT